MSAAPPRRGPLRPTPPLTALSAFERAATHLSFQLAARDLALSPSAVSHQIRGLEDYFGAQLFARTGKGVALTVAGATYLQSVSQALSQLDEASRALLRRGHGLADELKVSVMPFFAHTLLPELPDFERRHPGALLRISATAEAPDFSEGGVDVAIRCGREGSLGLKLDPLLDLSYLPVASPALIARGLNTPADLARHKLIHVTAQAGAWAAWLADVGQQFTSPPGEMWVDSTSTALEAAGHGLGVALGVAPIIERRPGFGSALRAVFPAHLRRDDTLYFICRPEQAHDRRVAAFRTWLGRVIDRTFGLDAANDPAGSPPSAWNATANSPGTVLGGPALLARGAPT